MCNKSLNQHYRPFENRRSMRQCLSDSCLSRRLELPPFLPITITTIPATQPSRKASGLLRHFWKKSDRKVIKEKKPPSHNEKKVESLNALKSPTSPAASIASKTTSKSAGFMSLLFCCAFTPFQQERHGEKI
ncbi:unnamed protein product [Umbelopsis ramanniana]